ncbi:MAG: PAS domain S-box protein [Deltaproteobacteria bacterium]|nr:PAS domain S-box protein [Deltaproteobacteria bacterium]
MARIMIVEDEEPVSEYIASSLKMKGHTVCSIERSGEGAVEAAMRERPDLVLMDILLEGRMDGVEAAGKIRARQNVPVVYLTSCAEDEIFEQAKVTEPYGFLLKPFKDEELHRVIEISLYKAKMEQKLRESEERYRNLVENISDVVYEIDANGVFTYISPACKSLAGYSPEEVVGRSFVEFLYQEDVPRVLERFKEIKSGLVCETEYRIAGKSGEVRWVRSRGTPIIVGDDFTGARGVLTDITHKKQAEKALQAAYDELERQVKERTATLSASNQMLKLEIEERARAEEKLKESEERYRHLVKYAPAGIYEIDFETQRFSNVNDVLCAYTGYSKEEFESLRPLDLLVGESRDLFMKRMEAVSCGENITNNVEYKFKTKDGEERWAALNVRVVWEKGKQKRATVIVNDITERREAEARLKKSKVLLQVVFDGIPDPLMLVDQDNRVRSLNKSAMKYFGLAQFSDAIGKPCFEAFAACRDASRRRPKQCEQCQIKAAISKGEAITFEREKFFSSGKHEMVSVYPLGADETGFAGAAIHIRDITEAKIVERQLIQSEKLASLGFLVSGIAHEINNPNNFITFNIPILKDYLKEIMPIVDEHASRHPEYEVFGMSYAEFREDLFRLLDNIKHGSDRINTTVSDLRRFARKNDETELRPVDLREVVKSAVGICRGQVRKMVKSFELHLPESPINIHSDPGALEQVVVNLLINAAQAVDKQDSWVKLEVDAGRSKDKEIAIQVSDNGCGMDEVTRKRIFDPFFTTKPVGEGTGLGLSVCYSLVQALGGRIEVESELGAGSAFRVVLPRL